MTGAHCSQCGAEFARSYSHCGDHILAREGETVRRLFAAHVGGVRSEAAVRVLVRAGLVERDGSLSYRGRLAAATVDVRASAALEEVSS